MITLMIKRKTAEVEGFIQLNRSFFMKIICVMWDNSVVCALADWFGRTNK